MSNDTCAYCNEPLPPEGGEGRRWESISVPAVEGEPAAFAARAHLGGPTACVALAIWGAQKALRETRGQKSELQDYIERKLGLKKDE